jgi:hypothetical protein
METFQTPEPIELELRVPSGTVEVDAGDTQETTVDLEAMSDDDASRAAVESARIELHGGRLLVDVPEQKVWGISFGRGAQVRLRVRTPAGARVLLSTRSADARLRGRLARLDAQTTSGDVEVEQVDGDALVRSVSGDLDIGRVAGELELASTSGDATVARAEGPLQANMISGDVTVREAESSARVKTVSGDQRLDVVSQGDVDLRSVSGDIVVGVRRGSRVWIDANSVSGNLRSDLDLSDSRPEGEGTMVELRARTVSGDLRVGRAEAPVGSRPAG